MKRWFSLTGLASTLIVSSVLFAQQPQQPKAKVVYEPMLRYGIPNRHPDMYTFNLKDIVKPNKKYQIWIDNNNVCTPIGQISPGDLQIRFVEILEPILLPSGPRIIYENPNQTKPSRPSQQPSTPKRHYTISPLNERRLPDGRLEIKILTPDGEQTIITNGK